MRNNVKRVMTSMFVSLSMVAGLAACGSQTEAGTSAATTGTATTVSTEGASGTLDLR